MTRDELGERRGTIPDSAHYPFVYNPEAFNEALPTRTQAAGNDKNCWFPLHTLAADIRQSGQFVSLECGS